MSDVMAAAEAWPINFPRKGVYQLLIHLSGPERIKVGKLGSLRFAAGYYVYTGRAMGGLKARLDRHFRKNKKMRWHIDYLLRRARIIAVQVFPPSHRGECQANSALLSKARCAIVPNFGSSDCSCKSHLAYLGQSDAAFYAADP